MSVRQPDCHCICPHPLCVQNPLEGPHEHHVGLYRSTGWSRNCVRHQDALGGLRTATQGGSEDDFKDLRAVTIGFIVSLVLAATINPVIREALFK